MTCVVDISEENDTSICSVELFRLRHRSACVTRCGPLLICESDGSTSAYITWLHSYPEDKGDTFLRNISLTCPCHAWKKQYLVLHIFQLAFAVLHIVWRVVTDNNNSTAVWPVPPQRLHYRESETVYILLIYYWDDKI